MPLKVILFYQHIGREYGSLANIRDELVSLTKGNIKVLIRSIDFEWHATCREARRDGVDIVVMPWLYIDSNYALMAPFIKINPDVVIVNIHQEQIGSPSSEIVFKPKGEAERNGCFHFCWGEYFANKLEHYGVRRDLIRIPGNARLDELVALPPKLTREELAERYSLDPEKKWVLFAENRGWVYKATREYKNEMLSMGLSEREYEEGKCIDFVSMKTLFEQIRALPDSYFDSCEFIYRSHPGTTVGNDLDPRVIEISREPIGTWLRAIQLLVVWGSTSSFEAEICNTPVVRHEPINNPVWHRMAGLSSYPFIKDIGTTLDIVEGRMPLPTGKEVYEHYFGKVDGKRARSVAETLLEVSDKSAYQSIDFNMTNEFRQAAARKRTFEATTKFICNIGLLERIRWPRSAYNEKNDIPYYRDNLAQWA